jgi:hypothetical protein
MSALGKLALASSGVGVGVLLSMSVSALRAPGGGQQLSAVSVQAETVAPGTRGDEAVRQPARLRGHSETAPGAVTPAQMLASRLEAHQRAPRREAWAARAEAGFRADLARLDGVSVIELSCQEHTCAGRIEWPTRAAAEKNHSDVLHAKYEETCDRLVVVDDERSSRRATVYFDCKG